MRKSINLKILVSFLMIFASNFNIVANENNASLKNDTIRNYNRISIGYQASFVKLSLPKIGGILKWDLPTSTVSGVNMQYIHGFGLPITYLFIETGIGINYEQKDNTDYVDLGIIEKEQTDQFFHFAFDIPLNANFRYNFNKILGLDLFTGLNFRINAILRTLTTVSGHEIGYHYFKKEDFGTSYSPGKRFQLGWQIGSNLRISKICLGFRYVIDFMPLIKFKRDYSNLGMNSSRFIVSISFQ